MALPNYLVLGAAKAATTALYLHLQAHPDVYVTPQKETHFFAFKDSVPDFQGPHDATNVNAKSITSLDAYQHQFTGSESFPARGEVCPSYLYVPEAAANIQSLVPEARLIIMLRHPVDRAYSHYLFHVRGGTEPVEDFAAVVADEPRRIREHWSWVWHVVRMGLYHQQLLRYLERFPRQQLRIHLYEDFRANPSSVLQDIYRFIGVAPSFQPDLSRRPNRSGIPQNRWLHALVLKPNIFRTVAQQIIPDRLRLAVADAVKRHVFARVVRPEMDPETRAHLLDFYRDDILKTQELLQRDLSNWLK